MIRELFSSFTVIALFVSFWALSQEWVNSWARPVRIFGAGAYMGAAAIASMLMAVPFTNGVIFDLRSVVLGLAGFFAGPFAMLLAATLAVIYRVWLGGMGVWAGLTSIALGSAIGCLAFYVRNRRKSWSLALAAFCLGQAALPLLSLGFLPAQLQPEALRTAALPLILLNLVASYLAASGIELSRRRGWLTHLLKAAIAQAPDYFYIKDRHSRFVIANAGVLAATRTDNLDQVIGRTDFDFLEPDHAGRLFEQEQALLRSGEAIADLEETVTIEGGAIRTYVTTKTPIRNEDGSIAGLVGFTKDLTDRVRLERQLRDTQIALDTILTGMSDGLARFDADQRLIFANANYQKLFPLTGHVRRPGVGLIDILDAVARTGEQVLPPDTVAAWKEAVLERTRIGGDEQVEMSDGRWLLIKSQPLASGGTVVIASDVTNLKHAEAQLVQVAEQFRVLASTDPLTGLHNRRDFDAALLAEFNRATRAGTPLSLILADIDHFKRYNDTYGHPAGDVCLRQVAACFLATAQRGGEMAARYGGEEFAVILPGVDAAAAVAIAEKILAQVRALDLPHSASPSGRVAISLGVAAFAPAIHADTAALLRATDIALYGAKAAGRGRVTLAA